MTMHKKNIFTVMTNDRLTEKTYAMTLVGDTSTFKAPGQFVNIAIEGKYLRRPISVCDYDDRMVTLLYNIVGDGTREMSRWQPGQKVDMLTGLGNGFNLRAGADSPVLLGGGIGIAPLYNLAKRLVGMDVQPTVVLGFNTREEMIWTEQFAELCPTYVSTVDGSFGTPGFVTDAIRDNEIDFDYFYACGPMPMLKALCESLPSDGEVSLEERMACGFGICMCCCIETKSGMKGVCKAGPVFKKDELIWK